MNVRGSTDEATKRSLRVLENSGTRFKEQVSSVTRRECNVIAVRSTKNDTPSRCDVSGAAPHRSRGNLSVERTRKMHGNVYGDPVWDQHTFRQRDLAATFNNERVLASEGTMRCNGNRPGRVGAPCEGSQSQECNGRSDGSISIRISFGAYAIQSLSAVRSPLTWFPAKEKRRENVAEFTN